MVAADAECNIHYTTVEPPVSDHLKRELRPYWVKIVTTLLLNGIIQVPLCYLSRGRLREVKNKAALTFPEMRTTAQGRLNSSFHFISFHLVFALH